MSQNQQQPQFTEMDVEKYISFLDGIVTEQGNPEPWIQRGSQILRALLDSNRELVRQLTQARSALEQSQKALQQVQAASDTQEKNDDEQDESKKDGNASEASPSGK